MAENLSVSWDDHQKNICRGLAALQQRGEFVDMTLAADGHHVKVHQMVLSLVSPFVKDLITSANCPHPVIFLNRVSYETMQAILEYAYTGEVVVRKDKMGEFLEACKDLHIRGLENMMKNVRATVSNIIFSGIETQRDSTEKEKPDSEREDNAILSYSRKRKKPKHKEIFEEIIQFDDNDDFPQHDVIDEGQVDSDWNDEANNTTPVESVIHTAPKSPKSVASKTPIQYSVSCQGNLQVVVNRYLYALRHTRKNEQRFWRCISQQKTGCPAIVTTFEDAIVERCFPHNHSFHDVQILKRVKNGNMFTNVNEVEAAAAAKKQKKEETDLFKQAENATG